MSLNLPARSRPYEEMKRTSRLLELVRIIAVAPQRYLHRDLVVSKGLSLLAGRPSSRLNQARGQFIVLAACLVIQQIEVVVVFFQCQEDSDRLTLCANDVPCAVFS
jgi:hypothetical protein